MRFLREKTGIPYYQSTSNLIESHQYFAITFFWYLTLKFPICQIERSLIFIKAVARTFGAHCTLSQIDRRSL